MVSQYVLEVVHGVLLFNKYLCVIWLLWVFVVLCRIFNLYHNMQNLLVVTFKLIVVACGI